MPETRDREGGIRLASTYELWDAAAQNDAGGMALQTVMHILGETFWNAEDSQPQTGFIGDGCLVVNGTNPLDINLTPGFGCFLDGAETDEFGPWYKPIVVSALIGSTLAAHDATNPRIDIVAIRPATVDDQTATRSIWDTTLSAASSQSVQTRRRQTYVRQVVTGTPGATPAVPVTPVGYIKIAQIAVPAASGTVVVTDTRPILQLGQKLLQTLPAGFARSHVISNTYAAAQGELVVTADGATLDLAVAAGEVSYWGYRYRYEATTVVVVPDASLPVKATIVANTDGTISAIYGTPAASPSPATIVDGDGRYPLYDVLMLAAATAVTTGNLTDRRDVGGPIDTLQLVDAAVSTAKIADDAVTAAKLGYITLKPALTVTAVTTMTKTIDIVSQDLNGDMIASAKILLETYDENGTDSAALVKLIETGLGTEITTDPSGPRNRILIQTSASGQAQVTVTMAGPTTVAVPMHCAVTPIGAPGPVQWLSFTFPIT